MAELKVYDLLDILQDLDYTSGTCDTIIGIFATTLKEKDVEYKLKEYMKYGIIKEKLSEEEIDYLCLLSTKF